MRKHGNGTIVGCRWRDNPLCRPSDTTEARIVLVAWTVAIVGGTALGAAAAYSVDDTIERDAAARTPVAAVMTGTDPALRGLKLDYVPAKIRWTGADGTVRTATTDVKSGIEVGETVHVWCDAEGHLVAPPVHRAEAVARGVLAGVWVAGASGLAILACGRVVRLRVERRATERWGEEWARADREWGSPTG
ncbi:Rv1733c family protein [Streptomyces sp. YIM S03343]